MTEALKKTWLFKSYLNDPSFLGSLTPEYLSKGPLEERHCTDLLCYILFIACWVGSVFIAFYSFANGNPEFAFRPADPSNHTCGYDEGYVTYPYLYFAEISDLTKTVCVSQCPSWNESETAPSSLDCKVNSVLKSCNDVNIYQSYEFAGVLCLPKSNSSLVQAMKILADIPDWQKALSDLYTAKWMFLIAPFAALVIGFLWVFLLRYCAGPMTWGLILLFFATLIGGGFWSLKMSADPETYNPGLESLNATSSRVFKIIAFSAWGVAAISLILLIWWFRRISLAIAVISCASEFIQDVPQILLIPPIFFVLVVIYYIYWAIVSINLWSVGNIVYSSQGYPFKSVQHSTKTNLFGALHIWHGFWNFFFIMAVPQFVIASTTCYWYFEAAEEENLRQPVWKSLWRGLVVHGGSIALGSSLLAIISIIKTIVEYFYAQLKTGTEAEHNNSCVKYVYACVAFCLDCFERFIRYLNQQAYVQVAMTGDSFCKAAEDAFYLGLRNIVRFGSVHGLGSIFTFGGEVLITAVVGIGSYFMLTKIDSFSTNLFNPIIPAIFSAGVAFVVASNFMSVFGVTADTIIHIFCMDEEIHKFGAKHAPPLLRDFIEENFGQSLIRNQL